MPFWNVFRLFWHHNEGFTVYKNSTKKVGKKSNSGVKKKGMLCKANLETNDLLGGLSALFLAYQRLLHESSESRWGLRDHLHLKIFLRDIGTESVVCAEAPPPPPRPDPLPEELPRVEL